MRPIALVDMDIRSPESLLADRLTRVDCYTLVEPAGGDQGDTPGPPGVLDAYAAVVVPAMVDQEHLAAHRGVIREYLQGGGVVVFGGHLHRDWLPGASPFVPLRVRSHRDYEVAWVAEHPIFADVERSDLTYRRGVAGFFARGHHPPPAGAEVLVRLAGGQPVTYLDRCSTAGTILVQSSADLLGYNGLDSSAGRIPAQLLDWIAAEADERRARAGTAR